MADLSPPPQGSNILDPRGSTDRGWTRWFQDNWERSFDGYKNLVEVNLSNDNTLEITKKIDSRYDRYRLTLTNLIVSGTGSTLSLVFSNDAGSSFDTRAVYEWIVEGNDGTPGTATGSDDPKIELLNTGISTADNALLNGDIEFFQPSAGAQTQVSWNLKYRNNSENLEIVKGTGQYGSTNAVDALKLTLSSGKFTSGTYVLYGIR